MSDAPAVHTDALWGGARAIENAGPTPVHVETKQQYWDLLNSRGLRLKDMQESSTGPARDPIVVAVVDDTAPPPSPGFTALEAELFHAHEGVLARYGLIETLGCQVCWEANRASGCRTTVNAKGVRVECRCGVREYRAPSGTTDLPTALPNATLTLNDQTTGTILDSHGQQTTVPTTIISPSDADLIRHYRRLLTRAKLARTLFCRFCCGRRFTEETALLEQVSDTQIVYRCACRLRFSQT